MRPPPDDEHAHRITELTELIDRMGTVNLDAMREHEEAEKRYAFYPSRRPTSTRRSPISSTPSSR